MSYLIGSLDGVNISAEVTDATDANVMGAKFKGLVEARKYHWRPADEWHDDDGPVLWVHFPPDGEAWPYDLYFGSPLDEKWDEDAGLTHWMPLPARPMTPEQLAELMGG